MEGYVLNKSKDWAHAMKRDVRPGEKISLSELYNQYGKKHGLQEGEEFLQWLKSIKLKDVNKWLIVLEDKKDDTPKDISLPIDIKDIKTITTADDVSPKKMSVQDVYAMSVRKAREVLPEISDINLLKYSLQEANKLAGKDSLCRIIRKRISELETISR